MKEKPGFLFDKVLSEIFYIFPKWKEKKLIVLLFLESSPSIFISFIPKLALSSQFALELKKKKTTFHILINIQSLNLICYT